MVERHTRPEADRTRLIAGVGVVFFWSAACCGHADVAGLGAQLCLGTWVHADARLGRHGMPWVYWIVFLPIPLLPVYLWQTNRRGLAGLYLTVMVSGILLAWLLG